MGVTIQKPRSGAMERMFNNAVKVGIVAAGKYWHDVIMPMHFTTAGAAKYDYAPRTAKYMRRKASKRGHQKPLVYSGQSRDQAIHDATITGTTLAGEPGAVVAMDEPDYFFMNPNGGDSFIDKPDELTRVTPDEEQILSDVLGQSVSRSLNVTLPSISLSA